MAVNSTKTRQKMNVWIRRWPGLMLAILIGVAVAGTAVAAQFAGEDKVYRLAVGEVIDDDLYVGAEEIYIDGTVNGDLIAAAGYIEVNGTVTGDILAAGAGISIHGQVGDDVRIAGAGIDISGTVAGDVLAAGGGNPASGAGDSPLPRPSRSAAEPSNRVCVLPTVPRSVVMPWLPAA